MEMFYLRGVQIWVERIYELQDQGKKPCLDQLAKKDAYCYINEEGWGLLCNKMKSSPVQPAIVNLQCEEKMGLSVMQTLVLFPILAETKETEQNMDMVGSFQELLRAISFDFKTHKFSNTAL